MAGDKAAFGALVTGYERRLFGFLGRMGFDQATGSDLAQDIFVRAWRHRATYDARRGSSASSMPGAWPGSANRSCRPAGKRAPCTSARSC